MKKASLMRVAQEDMALAMEEELGTEVGQAVVKFINTMEIVALEEKETKEEAINNNSTFKPSVSAQIKIVAAWAQNLNKLHLLVPLYLEKQNQVYLSYSKRSKKRKLLRKMKL